MTSRSLWRVSVVTSADAEEAVREALVNVTRQPASIYTDADSGQTTVSVYLTPRSGSSRAMRARLRAALDQIDVGMRSAPRLVPRVNRIRHEDWAESWKRHFKPIEIGSALLLKPSWSRRAPKPGQAVVVLDPGLSFGTGQHPTTRFCLEQLVNLARRDNPLSFLDIGTGSGILAIVAARLGYSPIEAFDYDRESVRVAAENARVNGVRRRIRLRRLDVCHLRGVLGRRFDVVCANLTADVLLNERRRIISTLAAGGHLVLAGILRSQFGEVQSAYERSGLKLAASFRDGEWESGAFARLRRP